ncbi:hypothetical protein P4H66_19465 [Paenibacillus dokdonensis]|uniref:Uncharacterized protein n=1 Tax=Paenibacillus dokdonensis TaxID=2567944 RepID=A0ABU6GQI1_9BACL|nr:hypothetical protein [Paenibacillus dokdonensis]MEC0241985.1 hypothetical protein [Paenibacillus dokdonensis]
MSQYLSLEDEDKKYFPDGVVPTLALIIRASSIIDGHCKREIAVKSYTERIPLTNQRGHLSYYPVVIVDEIRGRASHGWTGDNFFGPPQLEDMDVSALDLDKQIGTVICGSSPFGAAYNEIEVTYTSGWVTIPDKVKVACGLLVGLLAANPNSNVKSKKDFDFSIEYFSRNIITPEISDLLSEYELRFFR